MVSAKIVLRIVGTIALLLVSLMMYDLAMQAIGARDAEIRRLRGQRDSVSTLVDSVKKAYRRDTVVFTKWRTAWRDSIVAKWDTLHDTVKVPVEVVRGVIDFADSTIQSCRDVVRTCEYEKHLISDELNLAVAEIYLLNKQLHPPLVTRVVNASKWILVGMVLRGLISGTN